MRGSAGTREGTKKKTSASRAHRRLFRLERGHTLRLLLVTQLKVLAPGQRLVRLVFASGALEAEDHLLGGFGLGGGSTGMGKHNKEATGEKTGASIGTSVLPSTRAQARQNAK